MYSRNSIPGPRSAFNAVMRNRAPIFIAEVDPEKLCVRRATERVLFPDENADIGAGFGVKSLFSDPEIRAGYQKYSDIDMLEKQQKLAVKKDVVSRWFGEWDEINGTAWQAAIIGKSSVVDALKKSAQTWNDLKKQI